MSSICRICLRSDLLLQTPNEDLKRFYDELCEYDGDISDQFCGECLYSLKKCYRFKQRCQLAVNTFKEWQKKSKFKSIEFLHSEMPKSQLSLCNKNNFKVYFYQAPDVNTAAPIQISNCRHPHVVTVNIPSSEYTEEVQIEPPVESEMSDDEVYFLKVDPNFDPNDKDYKVEFTELDSTKFNGNISENETNADFKMELDSDASLDELLSDIQMKSLLKDKKVQKPKKDDNEAREKLRKIVQNKFESSGVVKDDKGNVIDMDLVLSCLDKSSWKTASSFKRICSGPGPFKPLAISKLSELQNRFTKYESVFTTVCLREESLIREEFEKRREHIDYTSSQHRCEKCIRGFKFSKSLDSHIKTYHNESLGSICKYCQTRFRNKRCLMKHIALHSVVYRCKLCHFVTNYRSAMNRHFNQHNDIKYQCKYCQQYFRFESKLYSHYNEMHASRHNICEFCGHTFNKEKGLIGHKSLKHRGEEFVQSELNKKCDECDVIFINDDVYRTHLRITHKGHDVIKKRIRNVKIVCRVCNREGDSPGWLVAHFLKEHPNEDMEEIYSTTKKYLCQDCGKRFSNNSVYKDHMNIHMGAKPYACTKCEKAFHRKQNLLTHYKRHSPPTKMCKQCGKKFTTSSYLASHMRRHIGDRRYKCNICGKGFLYPASVREHMNGVHFNIKRKRKTVSAE